jgi:hypothetical protein
MCSNHFILVIVILNKRVQSPEKRKERNKGKKSNKIREGGKTVVFLALVCYFGV